MSAPVVRVRDVATFWKGKKPSVSFDVPSRDALPYILIESFGGTYRTFTNDRAGVRCYREDTIVVADGANTGLASTGHEGYLGSTLGLLRPDQSKVHHRYLFYFVQGNFSLLNTRTRGAAVPHLERELLLDLEFSLPSLAEQKRIVGILDEAATLANLRQEADGRLSTLVRATYMAYFGNERQRRAWPTEIIANLAASRDGSIRTGPFGSQLLHSEFVSTGIPVLGIDNVVTNEFVWSGPRCIPPAKYKQFERFRVYPGDVLVTIMGTVGRCCVAPADLPVCISTKHLCVITPDRQKVLPRFLWAAFLYDHGIKRQMSAIGSGSIMEGWNSTIIRQLKLQVPPLALQEEFGSFVADVSDLQSAQTNGRGYLQGLSQSLRYRAFQGTL